MKKLLFLFLLGVPLLGLAQRNVPLPSDVGAPIPRSRPLQGTFRPVVVNGFVKYQDYLGNLIDPATLFNIVSTTIGSGTAVSGITQSFADTRYRLLSDPISYSSLTGKPTIPTLPTSLTAFSNEPGYQTSTQVTTAIGAATTPLAQSIAQNASDLTGKLGTATYTTNRSTDQAAVTTAQNTANTALTIANSATAAASSNASQISSLSGTVGGKVDKTTTITVNGVSQPLSGPISFSIAGTNSTTLTQVSQLSNDANYQTGSQVGAAISSAVNSVTNNQQTTDNNQTLSISQKLSTTIFNSFSNAQAITDQAQSTSISQNSADIGNRLLTSTYTANRATDQAATTTAQNTANTALTTANSATATAASNSSAVTSLQNAGYQTATQVATAVSSGTASAAASQTATDAAQNTQIATRLPGSFSATQASRDAAQDTDIAGRLLSSTYATNRTADQNATAAAQTTANSATATAANNTTAIAGKQPLITSSTSLTAGSILLGDISGKDSSGRGMTTRYFWDNVPRFVDVQKDNPAQFDTAAILRTIRTDFIRGLFSGGTGITITAAGVISTTVTGGSSSTNVVTGTDPNNTGSTATFLLPPANGGRVFIGNSTYQPYSLNFRYVSTLENMPGFKSNLGNLGFGLDADATILRINNVVSFNSSSTGTGLDNGYAWYGSPTRYMQINETNGDKAPLLMRLSTAGSLSLTGALSTSAISTTNVAFADGTTQTTAAKNYVLASASPYIPVSTSGASFSIGDQLTGTFGQLVIGRSVADIQAAINALPTSGTIVPRLSLFGNYDFSGATLTVDRNVELVGLNQTVFNGGTANGFLVLFKNISTRLLVENITFRSNSTTSPYALTYFNEQGDSRNVTFRNDRWHAPKGNYNAFGANAWNGSAGCFYDNWTFDNCVVDSVGRMGYEFLAHKNDGVIRIRNLFINNCQANNVGLYNPAGVTKASAQINGMGWSFSGDMDGIQMNNPISKNGLVPIEVVSAKNVTIVNPFITGTRSSTYVDSGITTIVGAAGFSITDGGSTDGGTPGRAASNITITGGYVNVVGKGVGTYYADRVSITGTRFLAGAYMELQHATRLNFDAIDYEMTGKNFIASFEDVKNSQIKNSRFSRENNTVSPIYNPINLDGNTANNLFANLTILTNTAVSGGNPDNYFNDQQPYRLRYINESGTNNSIKDIYLNGVKQPDQVIEVIPTLAITAAGSTTALTHIARINVNPTTTISSLTLVLPATGQDRKDVEVNFGGSLNSGTVVTTLTINGPGGNAPVQSNTPTSASAGQVFTYRYDSTISRYRRIN